MLIRTSEPTCNVFMTISLLWPFIRVETNARLP
jgi:hypothetical protein